MVALLCFGCRVPGQVVQRVVSFAGVFFFFFFFFITLGLEMSDTKVYEP